MFRVKSNARRLARFGRKQDGNATIEFVLLFPIFMFLFMTGFEAGYYLVRGVMLERATDIATRDVRLGNGKSPGYAALKKRICEEAVIIPDCMKMVQVEVRPIPPRPGGVKEMSRGTRCVDKDGSQDPLQNTIYDTGSGNQLMVVRVCALADPLFPSTPVGAGLKSVGNGNVALITRGGFVKEPNNGAGRAAVGSYSTGGGAGGSGSAGGTGTDGGAGATGAGGAG